MYSVSLEPIKEDSTSSISLLSSLKVIALILRLGLKLRSSGIIIYIFVAYIPGSNLSGKDVFLLNNFRYTD